MDLLNKERDIVGVYISGHPLDKFRLELDHLCAKQGLSRLETLEAEKGKVLTFGGLITSCEHRISKSGRPWGFFALEDYNGTHEFRCFGEDYVKFKSHGRGLDGDGDHGSTARLWEEGLEAKPATNSSPKPGKAHWTVAHPSAAQCPERRMGGPIHLQRGQPPRQRGGDPRDYDDEAKLKCRAEPQVQLNDGFVDDPKRSHPRKAQYRLVLKR